MSQAHRMTRRPPPCAGDGPAPVAPREAVHGLLCPPEGSSRPSLGLQHPPGQPGPQPSGKIPGTAANPGGQAQSMLIALSVVESLVCIYANGGLISCSPRWVSSGLGLTPARPGLKSSLASGTNAQPDGGLSRLGWPVALAAEGSSQDLSVLMGGTGGCGLMFLWLSPSGGPRNILGPALGLLLPGTGFTKLTLAPRAPSQARCPLSSCEGSCRPAGLRRGPQGCVLEPSQAAAQRQALNLLTPLSGGARGTKLQDFHSASSTSRPSGRVPRRLLPG